LLRRSEHWVVQQQLDFQLALCPIYGPEKVEISSSSVSVNPDSVGQSSAEWAANLRSVGPDVVVLLVLAPRLHATEQLDQRASIDSAVSRPS